MGLRVNSNRVLMTDSLGQTKFDTAKRFPHILGMATGTFVVPNIPYNYGPSYGTSCFKYTSQWVAYGGGSARQDSFALPFFQFSTPDITTGVGATAGNGTVLLRALRYKAGQYAGSIILDLLWYNGWWYLQCLQTFQTIEYPNQLDAGETGLTTYYYTDNNPYFSSYGEYLGTSIPVAYKIYFGRFT